MLEFKHYAGKDYPTLQLSHNAARFAKAFAAEFCKGTGVDVGCNRPQWALVDDALLVDPEICSEYHAMNLPGMTFDYIASSHMLEHYIGRWQDVVEYWLTKIHIGGVLFMYLPNCEYQKYWAWGNKKHVHRLSPSLLREYCEHMGYRHIVTDGYDLNGSFYVIIEKA